MKINYIFTLILVFCIGASIPILTGSSQVNEQHSAKSGAMTAANGWTAR